MAIVVIVDFQDHCVETVDIGADRLALLLPDGVEVVGLLLLPSGADKVIDKGLAQFLKGVDGSRLQT